jgi:hypothetical protein
MEKGGREGGGAAPGVMNFPKARGLLPTATVAVTVLVAVLMTETVLLLEFATYILVPSGVIPTPNGSSPTAIVAVTALLAVSITETLLREKLET